MKDYYVKLKEHEVIMLEDGFKYYLPQGHVGGVFSAHVLRDIANQLDEMNEEWQKDIDNYFNSQ